MATPGARAVLRLPRAGAFPRLRSVEAARQGGRRSVAGVAIARRQHSVQVLRVESAKGPWRRRGASGVGHDAGVLLPRQAARDLTSGVVSAACCRLATWGVWVWFAAATTSLLRWKFVLARCDGHVSGGKVAKCPNVLSVVHCTAGKLDLFSATRSRIIHL